MSEPRPRGPGSVRSDDPDRTPPLRGLFLTGVAGVVLTSITSAIAWSHVPDQMAVHFSGDSADRYAGRVFGLLAMPVTVAVVTLLVVAVNAADPYRANARRSSRALVPVWIAAVAVLFAVHLFMIMNSIRPAPRPGVVGAVLVGLLLVVIGNFLPKSRPNWVFGIRTPWTLTSSRSWYRTHRAGGVLFVITGLISLGVGVDQWHDALELTVGLSAVVSALLVFYSWWVWRGDPEGRGGHG